MRGELFFLRAFAIRNSLSLPGETLLSEPTITDSEATSFLFDEMFLNQPVDVRPAKPFPETESFWDGTPCSELIRNAVSDLEGALSVNTSLPSYYPIMLGSCYFALDEYGNSARWYSNALPRSRDPSMRLALYRWLAESCKRLGAIETSAQFLTKCGEEFPTEPKIHRDLARLHAERGDHKSAFEALLQEKECNPQFGEEWIESLTLKLGGLVEINEEHQRRILAQTRAEYPRFRCVIEKLVAMHWPSLALLSGEAREEWLNAVWQLHFRPSDGEISRGALRNAALCAIRAVEIELRQRLFLPFREMASSNATFRSFAGDYRRSASFLGMICRFLANRDEITFGQMVGTVEFAANNNDPISTELYRFAKHYAPVVLEKTSSFKALNRFRTPATHTAVSTSGAEGAIDVAKKLLEKLAVTRGR